MAKGNEAKYSDWSDRVNRRERIHQGRIAEWDKYLRYYRMDLTPSEAGDDDNIWVNYQYGYSRLLLPAIYFRNPEVTVRPRGATDLAYCFMVRDLLNYELNELGFEEEARKIVFDAFFCGYGVMKFGFAPALRRAKKPGLKQQMNGLFQMMFDLGPDQEAQAEATRQVQDGEVDPNDLITGELPFGVRISPKMFFMDETATTLRDARWCCHKIVVPVDEVKSSSRYPKSLTRGIEATHRIQDERSINEAEPAYSLSADSSLPLLECVVLYEVWDKMANKLYVLDSSTMRNGDGKYLLEQDNPYDCIDGFPFEMVVFNPDPEHPYGIPDAMIWHNPAQALNAIDSYQFNHIKRFNRKYITNEGTFAEEELTKLTQGKDGTVVRCRSNAAPGDAVHPLQDASLSPDVYALRDIVRNNMTFLSGVTNQRQGTVDKTRTATEASIVEQQARIRDNDRGYVTAKFVQRACTKFWQLSGKFLNPSFTAFLRSDAAAMLWQQSASEILKAEVDMEINVGSSAFTSKDVQVKQYMDFLNIAAPLTEVNPMTGMEQRIIDPRKFVQRIATEMNIPNWEDLVTPPPMMPMQGPPPVGPSSEGEAQSSQRRPGDGNLANMLSNVQNMGVRRGPPNPTREMIR